MSLQTGAAQDRSKTLQRMAQIRSSITGAQEDIATIGSYGESFDKNSSNIGNMGGLSASNDPKMVMAYQVLSGKAKGTTSLKVDPNNPSIRTWVVKGNIGGQDFEQVIDGNQLKNANEQGGGPFVYIPNTMDAMDQNKLNSGAYIVDTKQDTKGNTTRSLGLINDAYLGKEVLVDSPERITGKTVKQVYRQVDKEKIKPLLAIDANKQSAGLLADVRSASSWYNEVYAKGKNDFVTPLDLATQEGKQKFQNAYLQYIVDTIPDKQAVMTPDNNIATVTDVAPKLTKGKTGTTTTGGTSAADKKQNQLDQNVLSLIKSKKGSVRGVGGNVLKIIDGHWRAVDKNDAQIAGTEGISNPRELALYIGASRPLINE